MEAVWEAAPTVDALSVLSSRWLNCGDISSAQPTTAGIKKILAESSETCLFIFCPKHHLNPGSKILAMRLMGTPIETIGNAPLNTAKMQRTVFTFRTIQAYNKHAQAYTK